MSFALVVPGVVARDWLCEPKEKPPATALPTCGELEVVVLKIEGVATPDNAKPGMVSEGPLVENVMGPFAPAFGDTAFAGDDERLNEKTTGPFEPAGGVTALEAGFAGDPAGVVDPPNLIEL